MTHTLKQIRKTITTIFVVPTLKIPREELSENGFINGYVKDDMRDVQFDDSIYLLFRPNQIDRFRDFLESEYERTKSIISDYDYPDGFVVVVYKLNPKYKDDYNLVKEGKYSKTSIDFQNEFPKVIKIMKNGLHRDELSLQFRIFKRTGDLVKFWEDKFDMIFDDEQEIWYGFDEEDETLTKNKLDYFKLIN